MANEAPPVTPSEPKKPDVGRMAKKFADTFTPPSATPAAPVTPAPPANPTATPAAPEKPESTAVPAVPAVPTVPKTPETPETPETVNEWKKKLKAERDAAIENFDKLKKEHEEFKKVAVANPEVENLKKSYEEVSKQLNIVARERSPEFRKKYDNRIETQITLLKGIVPAETVPVLTALLRQPDSEARTSALSSVMEKLGTELAKNRFTSVINAIDAISLERQQELEQASSEFANQTNAMKLAQEKEHQQYRELFTSTQKKFEDSPIGKEVLKKADGSKSDLYDDVAKVAENIVFGKLTPEQMMTAAWYVGLAPVYRDAYLGAEQHITQLQEQVTKLQAATPGISASTPAGGTEPKKPDGKRFAEKFIENWPGNK